MSFTMTVTTPEEEPLASDDCLWKITTIYCCGPNASNKLKVISEVNLEMFSF